ncbi:hypothetical protein Ddye_020593 [Dipteronia dyeriana]|uniref:DDE Tnp4 domain-containing protein n=1 Tax=Dipteronia dyeriana TaxID=168575 RepID=A0AAD9U0U6_9ROSI|nr:hypothetical protein Ddye_020593 [Dipteronia dyeriana]
MITPPSFNDNSNGIANHRLRQIFKGAVGAIDGTLIHACIPLDKQVPYRAHGRGECFQNVMAICDFDMVFKYVVVGWEGTSHDSRILTETIRDPNHNFPMPQNDKYNLVDAAYTHTKGFMAPYRHVRYWLNDFRSGGRARGREEIFNHYHSRTGNVIERAFGVLKAYFPILKRMPPYSFGTQRNTVIACITLHNFLQKLSIDDELFLQYDDEDIQLDNDDANQNQIPSTNNEFRKADKCLCNNSETKNCKSIFVSI